MVLTSDINISIPKFDPASISPEQHAFNEEMIKSTVESGRWYKIGAQKYRELRASGKTALPRPTVLPEGIDFTVPSRDSGRDIPCRLFLPSSGAAPTATFLHIHGGGWVLQSHLDFDPYLQSLADGSGASNVHLATVSVGYRLAPEHPFPAAQNDCADVADWLSSPSNISSVSSRLQDLPLSLSFIGGESAGGHLSVLTLLHLLTRPSQPYLSLKGLVLHFGVFSLNPLPAWINFEPELILTPDIMDAYADAVTPAESKSDRKYVFDPKVSPLYANLEKLRGILPPALFTVGTADPLVDDTVLMGAKWQMAGVQKTYVKIFPGQPHGFVFFPKERNRGAVEAAEAIGEFLSMAVAE